MTVYLVGAGPGHADLLTLRAARLLANADVVVHDRLIGDDVMSMIAPWAERIDVGKDPNGSSVSQTAINAILVTQGTRHSVVVRLKGGDPYVFGRGGEEAIALSEVGLTCEVVPGITSAIAGPAAAGIPVTHRGASSGFTVITGFQNPENPQRLDWDAVARLGTTLVILMGASRADQIRDRLVEAGAPGRTPVAIVTRACLPTQSVQRCRLDQLGRTPIDNPSIIVVGPTAALDLAAIGTPFAAPTDRLLVPSTQGELPWQ
ncbi:MAG: uroporphyrin-III C-methyltransferase [Verrucomicrobiales bacterium]